MDSRDVYTPEDLGEIVRSLRRRRGWSQETLAEWLGVTRPTVAKLEKTGAVSTALALRALTLLGAVPTVHLKTSRLIADPRDDR